MQIFHLNLFFAGQDFSTPYMADDLDLKNQMTLISCPLKLLSTGNILTLQYYKTFGGFFLPLLD